MRFSLPFTLFLTCSFFFSACLQFEKPTPQEDLGFFALGEIADYLSFKEGSTWVYEYSETGERDTIVRQYFSLDTFFGESSKRKFSHEIVHFDDYSFSTKYWQYMFTRGLCAECTDFRWALTLNGSKDGPTFIGPSVTFFYPFIEGDSRFAGVGSFTCMGDHHGWRCFL